MAWSDINQKSPWVTTPGQYMLQSAQAAEGIGRTFSQGMAIGQRNKEFEAEAPLRQAQTDLAKLQAELTRMKQQEDKVRLEAMIEQRNTLHEAQKEIGGWMAQRGRLERIGLDDPQTVQAGYDWWAKRGKLLTHPEARALYDDWDNTVKAVRTENDRVKRDRENALNILGRQMEIEGVRTERQMELEKQRAANRETLEKLRQEAIAARSTRQITRNEWINRNFGTIQRYGFSPEEAVKEAERLWDSEIAPSQPASTPPQNANIVPVISPDGVEGFVPAEWLDRALQQGYRRR